MAQVAVWAGNLHGGPKDVAMAVFTAVTQGIVVTGVSVYAKQIIGKIGKK